MKPFTTRWFRKRSHPDELEAEMRAHIDLRTQANIQSGMTPDEARAAALRQFGWVESIKEECRDERGGVWLETLVQDIRFGARMILKHPGFAAVTVLTLALGIGANTAIYSIIRGVLLKPLPYPHPDQLVTLWERNPERGIEQERVSGPDYLDWREQNTVFADLAISPAWVGSENFNLVLRESTIKVHGSYTSASFFSTLGVGPLLGRTFLPEEDQREGNRVAVLSYGLWQRDFGGDANVIGRTLTVDTYGRRDYTVVGVMPSGFGLPGDCDLWLPIGWMGVRLTERRSAHWHNVIGRLKPGVTIAQARAELTTIQARLRQAYPGETIGSEVDVVPIVEQAVGRNLRTSLLILWGVVAGVLLIACANVADLMLARAAGRQKEIALRLALGAGRGRILRQLLAESLLLGLLGGAAGTALAWAGLQVLIASSPAHIPRLAQVHLDGTALVFTFGISVLTGVLFGLAPALHCSRPDVNESLKEGSHSTSTGIRAVTARSMMVVCEVALTVVLLTGAGLMLQSFARMLRAERGFQPEHLLTADLDFSVSGFTTWVRPTATRPQVPLKALIERIRQLPGVRAVGAGSRLLRRENNPPSQSFIVFGHPVLKPEEQPKADFQGITPDWLAALGGRLLQGRDFTEQDTLEAPGVVLINETMARRFFPNQNPIGERLVMGDSAPPLESKDVWGIPVWMTIVGVVADLKSLQPRPEAVPEVYLPYWKWPMQSPTLLVRTTAAPESLANVLREQTKALIPNLPTPSIRTMDELLSQTVAQPRLQTELLGLFAGLGLLLAAVGLYSLLSYSVLQRQREIGIRMALGAAQRNVIALVIAQGMKLVVIGGVCGVFLAMSLTRLMQALLYGIQPTDPLTFGSVLMLLFAVALVACWLPAWRAARVDPMSALRSE